MRKPPNLIYGVEDKPTLGASLLLGIQHIFVFFIGLILPVIVVRNLVGQITETDAQAFVSLTMVCGGMVTILQAKRMGALGSGYLCPSVCGPSYLSASMQAIGIGGLPLMMGMTAFVGAVEMAFSRIMRHMRFLFPAEVTGVVVAMVGIVVIPLAIRNFVGLGPEDTEILPLEVMVGILTLAALISMNVYGKGKLKLYSVLVGMIGGYALSLLLDIVPSQDVQSVMDARVVALPYLRNWEIDFEWALVIPFTVAALCSTLKTVGDISTCQKVNDMDWQRPDMESVSGGILADGIGGLLPGLVGGYGQSTSSTNVGLSIATGATSRRIAYAAGILFIGLAFFPKLSQVFIILPKPVMGALLIFSLSFMVVTGIQLITSRILDARKTFVVGASIVLGLSVDMEPSIYANIHSWIQPVFSSSLSLATVSVVVLNLLLRIGIKKRVQESFVVSTTRSDDVFAFFEKQGGSWGARREIIQQAAAAVSEFMDNAHGLSIQGDEVEVTASFDEINLDIELGFMGETLELPPGPPSQERIVQDKKAVAELSLWLTTQYADDAKAREEGDRQTLHLHFDH